ncbi:MAG: hypothetical protein J0M07_08780 [Anaerolineae bacterium]|nr:hypothetical protein [Chloroflexota bacterium]MBN8635402.1 hypothetical protein [Anaerolineae bacterium]
MVAMERLTLRDEILEFMTSSPTLEQILAFKPSEALQARASLLLDKNRAGTLTAEEQRELDDFEWMDDLVSLLKIRARKKLSAA